MSLRNIPIVSILILIASTAMLHYSYNIISINISNGIIIIDNQCYASAKRSLVYHIFLFISVVLAIIFYNFSIFFAGKIKSSSVFLSLIIFYIGARSSDYLICV
jgi:TRAP-type C4-dicarboxylate transport system permease small subunit